MIRCNGHLLPNQKLNDLQRLNDIRASAKKYKYGKILCIDGELLASGQVYPYPWNLYYEHGDANSPQFPLLHQLLIGGRRGRKGVSDG